MTQDLSIIESKTQHSLSLWDETNPRALINLIPTSVVNAVKRSTNICPQYFSLDEQALAKQLRSDGFTPTATDNRLRMKFWMEYDYAQANAKKKIDIGRALAGVTSDDYFYEHYLARPTKVAWLMCPPVGYALKTEEALEFGLEQLRDLLDTPHMVNGKLDAALAGIKLKIVALLDARVKGAITQKTMNVHAHTTNPSVANAIAKATLPQTMEAAQRRLSELKSREKQLENGGIINVTPDKTKEK